MILVVFAVICSADFAIQSVPAFVLQHVHGTFVAATGGKTVKKQEELVSSIDSESDQAESEEYQEDFEDDEEQQVAAPAVSKKKGVQSGSQNAPGRKV